MSKSPSNVVYTRNTEHFLQTLIEKILYSYKISKQQSLSYVSNDMNSSGQTVYSQNFDYIPESIKAYIKENINSHYTSTIKINKRTYYIHFGIDHNLHSTIQPLLTEYLQFIYTWLNVADSYASETCSLTMNIFFYFTDLKKKLPSVKTNVITMDHANTAFTTSCQTETEINVFRYEEWFKVFIHETFHNMGMDFSGFDNRTANKLINMIFPVNTDVRLYEAYTETFAELFNILHIACFKNDTETISSILNRSTAMLELETRFSLFQVSKIMNHYNLKYVDMFSLTEQSCNKRDTLYKEETAVLSYYVIKSILLYNINDFIIWCQKHNQGSINFSHPERTHNIIDNKIQQFCLFIEKKHNDVDFIDVFNEFDSEIQKQLTNIRLHKTDKVLDYAMNTLQMTIFPKV